MVIVFVFSRCFNFKFYIMKKRINIECVRYVDAKEKVLFRQSVFISDDLFFDFSSVERVLRCLFPETEYVTFCCSTYGE